MKGYRIRPAEPNDLPKLRAMARKTVDACYRAFLGDSVVDWYLESGESDRELEEHMGDCEVLVAKDRIIAFCITLGDLVHLIMVDVDEQRKGWGALLMGHVERRLVSEGYDLLRLESFAGNEPAMCFYDKLGWKIVSRKPQPELGQVRVYFEKNV